MKPSHSSRQCEQRDETCLFTAMQAFHAQLLCSVLIWWKSIVGHLSERWLISVRGEAESNPTTTFFEFWKNMNANATAKISKHKWTLSLSKTQFHKSFSMNQRKLQPTITTKTFQTSVCALSQKTVHGSPTKSFNVLEKRIKVTECGDLQMLGCLRQATSCLRDRS
jgi:hypothetical protein